MSTVPQAVTPDNWLGQLQPFLVGNHPDGDHADDLEILLSDMVTSLSFSIRGKRTLDRCLDYLERLQLDYTRAVEDADRCHEAEHLLQRQKRQLEDVIGYLDEHDDLGVLIRPFLDFQNTLTEVIEDLTQQRHTYQKEVKEFQTNWEDLLPQLQALTDEHPIPRVVRRFR